MLRFCLFVVSVMLSCTSIAGGASPCPSDAVPIRIVDEIWGGPDPVHSFAEVSNPHFRTFVMAITEHVTARLARKNPVSHGRPQRCINNDEGKNRSLLQFVARPILAREDEVRAPALSLDAQPSVGCRITSPWIELAVERRPVPWVRGVVRWNERQVLVDQAVLAGARNIPTGLAMQLQQSEFIHFAQDYANSEILRKPAAKPIGERIPPDLLWLFRHSWQSTRGPFGQAAGSAMDTAIEKVAERYTKLVIALIDRCLASDEVDVHYNSILDVSDLISLEQYKIDTLTY